MDAHFGSNDLANAAKKMNYPHRKLRGYQNIATSIYPKGVTPECFNRGSSPTIPWIPAKSMRE
jgi:hypothetical protein